jgi:hypothetical protein
MTKLAYLDCPTGISGDMCLGALVDLGVPLQYLTEHLDRLGIATEYCLVSNTTHRNGQRATKVEVELKPELASSASSSSTVSYHHSHTVTHSTNDGHSHHHTHHHHHHDSHKSNLVTATRHLPEIAHMIQHASLPKRVEDWSLAIFRRLAEAEGAVHGIPPEQVHFHEVGATDAIVDIVGTCLGLDWLGVEHIYCSALPTGGGTVRAAHGRLPVPPPAVLKLFELRQVPLYSNGIERELVTPTGAAIATTLASHFGHPPAMTLRQVGLGAGTQDLPIPNILRLWLGDMNEPANSSVHASSYQSIPMAEVSESNSTDTSLETIAVLETQIDDLSPQAIGYTLETLFAAGALDAFTQAIAMKKSRLGVLLTVLCWSEHISDCEAVIFRETTTLGIRRTLQHRRILDRRIETVQTTHGSVRIKVARLDLPTNFYKGEQRLIKAQPEYDDCVAIARTHHLPWLEIHRLALQTWHEQQQKSSLPTTI